MKAIYGPEVICAVLFGQCVGDVIPQRQIKQQTTGEPDSTAEALLPSARIIQIYCQIVR